MRLLTVMASLALLSAGCAHSQRPESRIPVTAESAVGVDTEAGTGGAGDDLDSSDGEALLAPFLTCTSPAEFVALQERVDMPRLVEVLSDWDAVRLGSLGPVREDAAALINRKRLSFILHATERYGVAHAEVFVRFILDSAYDDELREILFRLAQDKRLESTLGLMPRARAELEARGLKLSTRPDRDFEWGDLGRGVASAVADLATHEQEKNAWYTHYARQRNQLPPSYQEELAAVERAAAQRHFSPGNVVLGGVDSLTFGVPLGFYSLAASTGHGLYSLTQGQYEQVTRELTPVALLATLYAGGKSVRSLHEARGAATLLPRGLQTVQSRVKALARMTRQLEERLGAGTEGLHELARYIQASREAGRFVAVGGQDAALALYEARGDVARARPLLSKASPQAVSPSTMKGGTGRSTGTVASLVDEGAGLTREVVEARLALVELEATGPRLPRDVAVLEKQRPSVDTPPPGAEGNPRWPEYVAYYDKRLGELKQGKAAKAPLRWAPYEQLWGWFARGLAFERFMVHLLREDAKLPRAQRRFLGDFHTPRIETYVGVRKPDTGLRFADVLVIETSELAGRPPRVETFSFKSRDLSGLGEQALQAQMIADAREAVRYYGQTLDVRRDALQPLLRGGSEVPVQRVRLIYEGSTLTPSDVGMLERAVNATRRVVPGVEVLFQ